ncbi:MAG: Fe-S cluster assembly protein IscX [Nitrospiria bacterium]
MDWSNVEDIAIELSEKFPDTDPLTVRFTDLHQSIIGLSGFSGDPKKSNEKILEAIQMAWYEEYQEARK